MIRIAALLVVVVSTLAYSLQALAAESYAGYGSEPTNEGHVGKREYSPYLNIGYPQRVRTTPTASRAARSSPPATACARGCSAPSITW